MADKINVLLIGGGAAGGSAGGREHAMAIQLRASARCGVIYTTQGDAQNPGLAELCTPMDIPFDARDAFRLRRWCAGKQIGLAVIGPEDPLCDGLADVLGDRDLEVKGSGSGGAPAVPFVFGPSRAAARLEGDKAYAKGVMRSAKVPTAESRAFTDYRAAREYLESRTEAHVIKAAGLAKGKGVFVPASQAEALEALERVMLRREFGAAGDTVVIEEKLKGREVSVLALCDGRTIFVLEPCQDHKRLRDGATGPNTGGMGAVCPPPLGVKGLDERTMELVQREILVPTIDALRRDGVNYCGVLYAGLMLTPGGPKVLEFNCRFGDPECQVLLARWQGDLLEHLLATCQGRLDEVDLSFAAGTSVCVVVAAPGYPDAPAKGIVIEGLEDAAACEGVTILHAGTRRDEQGRIVTSGGRVLNVVASGESAEQARARAYAAVKKIRLPGKQVRTDIGTEVIG
jgi:phosphoribosylamine--glycine ligase